MKKTNRRISVFLIALILPIMCIIGVIFYSSNTSNYDIDVVSDGTGVLNLVSGEFFGTNVVDSSSGVEFLQTLQAEYGYENASNEFVFDKSVDATGGKVYKYNQVKNSIIVYGRSLSIFVDDNGRVISVSGNYKASNAKTESIDLEEFCNQAKANTLVTDIVDATVVIYNQGDHDCLAVKLCANYEGNFNDIILDAHSFDILQMTSSNASLNNLSSYTLKDSTITTQADADGNLVSIKIETYKNKYSGNEVTLLSDSSRNIYMAVMADGKTINSSSFWEYAQLADADSIVIEAYSNLVTCYEFYASSSNFGTSIVGLRNEAGKPIDLIAVVHAVENLGKGYDNAAYWILNSHSSYAYFLFGDGGSNATDYAKALDVVGHEYQHGVTTSVCNLDYLNEAGAINEAISDIFGALIEGYELEDDRFWLLGEDIVNNHVALRDMKNPSNPGLSTTYPDSVSNMYALCEDSNCSHYSCDYGGVHFNSNILTHATYNMYAAAPEFFTAFRIGELWYNTLTRLTTTSSFLDFRIQMEATAKALGYPANARTAIENAFISAGIILPEEKLQAEFYVSEADAELGINFIMNLSADSDSYITIPASDFAIDGKVHYYWTDGEERYFPGDKYMVEEKIDKLWAVYVDTSNIEEQGIVLEGNTATNGDILGEPGTITNPYQIHSPAEFLYLGYLINNPLTRDDYYTKEYSLKADIYLHDIEYTPIGISEELCFAGSFGGGNHLIHGLNLSNPHVENVGVFGVLGKAVVGDNVYSGSVYNLAVGLGETTTTAENAGSIAGVCYGSITTCYSKLSISSENTVGGLVGVLYSNASTSVANSYTEGNMQGDIVGGIVGKAISNLNTNYNQIFSSYIGNVYVTGDISGNIVGGISGVSNGYYFVNCITLGSITANTSENSVAGGVVGILSDIPYGSSITIDSEVYSGVLSAKVVSDVQATNMANASMLVARFELSTNYARIAIENNTIKNNNTTNQIGNFGDLPESQKSWIVYAESKISNDGAFKGDFDFDNLEYYTNTDNWTITRSISLFNLESVWRIVESEEMPRIMTYEFWINYASEEFSGGNGVTAPFEISSAEDLALLCVKVANQERFMYQYMQYSYASASYVLTRDIDLTGKIWVSIGLTIQQRNANDVIEGIYYNAFNGIFDGAGHTISNMNTMSVYSTSNIITQDGDYYLYSYNSGLFGTVANTSSKAVIKNFSMRNVSVSGSYASPVVSHLVGDAEISGVKIHSGNVSGASIAGGIVALVGDTGAGYAINLNISNCMNNATMSSRIVGGLVGKIENNLLWYINNTYAVQGSTVKIYNSVFRGNIYGIGDDVYDDASYYGLYAGGIVGSSGAVSLSLINNIYIGNINLYSTGYAGGLVGSTSYKSDVSSSSSAIVSSHNKLAGTIDYKFQNAENNRGSYLGGVLENTQTTTSISDTSSVSVQDISSIGAIEGTLNNSLNSIYSSDNIGEGVFAFDSMSYYGAESGMFDSSYAWTDTSSMIVVITFVDHNGDAIAAAPVCIPYGTKLLANQIPTNYTEEFSTAEYFYTFEKWDTKSEQVYEENTKIKGIYIQTKRTYKIIYTLQDGTIVDTKTQAYGDKIDTSVKAPEKQGNFLYSYEFIGWKFSGSTVTGDMEGTAMYRMVFGGNMLLAIITLVIIAVTIYVVTRAIKENKKGKQ